MTWQTDSTNAEDTELLGECLGSLLKGSEVIDLKADLGGGKTTFVRGLAKGIGSKNHATSPSFTLQKIYNSSTGLSMHHYDFYRLGNEPGVIAEQLAESLEDPKIITVVEWSDAVENVLPSERLSIEFKPDEKDLNVRKIIFNYSESMTTIIKDLENISMEARP